MTDDPYRVLGVERGTSIADIRRAYRRLVKTNHPDSAGPDALPRFLAIQAAYEELVEGKIRPRDVGRSAAGPPGPAWRADPERARATREHWRRRTSRPGGGPDPAGAGRGPGASDRGPGPSPGARPGRTSADAEGASSGSDGGRARADDPRSSRRSRATPGSTSYDGAEREPFDPEWGGASWYGPSSGTYWTINPKEYADPRKHGPEYQARARRGSRGADPTTGRAPGIDAEPTEPGEPTPPAGEAASAGARRGEDAGAGKPGPDDREWPPTPPREDRRSDTRPGARSRARPGSAQGGAAPFASRPRPAATAATEPAATAATEPAFQAGDRRPRAEDAASSSPPPASDVAPHWIQVTRTPGRILTALIAWPPIGLGAALLYGEVTGCARFSVECADATTPWPWVIQLVTIALFLLLPALARIAVAGTYAMLIVATPLTLFLVTGGRAGTELAPRLLVAGLVAAWLAGVLIALVRRRRDAGRGGPAAQEARAADAPPVP